MLFRLDLKKFMKCMEAGQLDKPEAFITTINASVCNISQTTNKPKNVYYFKKIGKISGISIYRNRKQIHKLDEYVDKNTPIAYCEGYICILVRLYDYPTNTYSIASKIIRLSSCKSYTRSVATHNHGATCRSIRLARLTAFSRRGVVYSVSYMPWTAKVDIIACHRSAVAMIASICLHAAKCVPIADMVLVNDMLAVEVDRRRIAVVILRPFSIAQLTLVME